MSDGCPFKHAFDFERRQAVSGPCTKNKCPMWTMEGPYPMAITEYKESHEGKDYPGMCAIRALAESTCFVAKSGKTGLEDG
jgi:hypothetical protein